MSNLNPLVGVGVMVIRDGCVLLGKRKGSHGAGEWAFPGGHLEHMETAEDCIRRELAEEVGIEVCEIRFQYCANVRKYAPKHYVHLGFAAVWKSGEPEVIEPDKCECWGWFRLDKLPEPLFEFARMGLDNLLGMRPFQER
jgi:8-oxo-dGTP diphosphatase